MKKEKMSYKDRVMKRFHEKQLARQKLNQDVDKINDKESLDPNEKNTNNSDNQ